MEVSRVMNVPIETIFDAITLSFKQDYYANTDIELSEEAIVEGLSYIKRFGKNNQNSIRITVQTFSRPNEYAVIYSSNQGKQLVNYRLKVMDDEHTEVIYTQSSQPLGFIQKLNAWLMEKLFKSGVAKKAAAQLKALEEFAAKQR